LQEAGDTSCADNWPRLFQLRSRRGHLVSYEPPPLLGISKRFRSTWVVNCNARRAVFLSAWDACVSTSILEDACLYPHPLSPSICAGDRSRWCGIDRRQRRCQPSGIRCDGGWGSDDHSLRSFCGEGRGRPVPKAATSAAIGWHVGHVRLEAMPCSHTSFAHCLLVGGRVPFGRREHWGFIS
jgi:hypothetical protein